MKEIYILLTKTHTVLSRTIAYVTKDAYTHAALSLNKELTELYSFGRIYKNNPFIGGFIKESFVNSVYSDNMNCNCAVYSIQISDVQFNEICEKLEEMKSAPKEFKYNTLGLLGTALGISVQRKNRFFCSEFVADMLDSIDMLPLDYSPDKTRPSDFTEMSICHYVKSGPLKTVVY